MRYLGVMEVRHRPLRGSLPFRSHWTPEWHAVADTSPKPIRTLCGFPYTSEAHRTWDQTTYAARCPQCQQLVTAAILRAKATGLRTEGTGYWSRP